MVNDHDALKKPWVVDVDGILVDPSQLRAVGRKLIAILDDVFKSGYAPMVFGPNLPAAAQTIVGIHQLIDQGERARALKAGALLEIRFPDQPGPDVEELFPVRALWLDASKN